MYTSVVEKRANRSQNIRNLIEAIPINTYPASPSAMLEVLPENIPSEIELPRVKKTTIPESMLQQDDRWHEQLSRNFDGTQNISGQAPVFPISHGSSMVLEAEATLILSFHWPPILGPQFAIAESMANDIHASFRGNELS